MPHQRLHLCPYEEHNHIPQTYPYPAYPLPSAGSLPLTHSFVPPHKHSLRQNHGCRIDKPQQSHYLTDSFQHRRQTGYKLYHLLTIRYLYKLVHAYLHNPINTPDKPMPILESSSIALPKYHPYYKKRKPVFRLLRATVQ